VPWWAIAAVAAAALYASAVLALALAGRRQDAVAIARLIPDCLVLLRRLLRDPRVPRARKWLIGAVLAYLALPLDLIPDVIPVAGQLDDAILVALVVRGVVRGAGAPVVRELWPGPERTVAVLLRWCGAPVRADVQE
jgi:uncharacterized membrane protein YkvA (DUF1232 family)